MSKREALVSPAPIPRAGPPALPLQICERVCMGIARENQASPCTPENTAPTVLGGVAQVQRPGCHRSWSCQLFLWHRLHSACVARLVLGSVLQYTHAAHARAAWYHPHQHASPAYWCCADHPLCWLSLGGLDVQDVRDRSRGAAFILYAVWVGLLIAFWVVATLLGYPGPENPSPLADAARKALPFLPGRRKDAALGKAPPATAAEVEPTVARPGSAAEGAAPLPL